MVTQKVFKDGTLGCCGIGVVLLEKLNGGRRQCGVGINENANHLRMYNLLPYGFGFNPPCADNFDRGGGIPCGCT